MIIMRKGFRAVPRCGATCMASLGTRATSEGFLHDSATAVTPFWLL